MIKPAFFILIFSTLFLAACQHDADPGSASEQSLADATPFDTTQALKTVAGSGPLPLSANVNNSSIEWSGSVAGREHRGTIALRSGEFFVLRGFLKAGDFLIDMNSLTVTDLDGEEKVELETALKGPDFFHVAEHPTALFSIFGVGVNPAYSPGSTHEISGNLSMHGVTKKVTFPATISVKDGNIYVQTPEFIINRTDWGINFRSGMLGTAKEELIADELKLKLKIEAPLPPVSQ